MPERKAKVKPKAELAEPTPGTEPLPPLAPTLRVLDTRVLRGPNVWVKKPVIRMSVDLGVLEQYPSNTIPGFNEALMALLPTMEEHACSLGPPRRLLQPARGRHLDGPRGGAHRARAAVPRGHRGAHRQDPLIGHRRARYEVDLRVPRGAGRARGGPHRGGARQLFRRAR